MIGQSAKFDARRNRDFVSAMIDVEVLLNNAVYWVQANLKPQDVFSRDELADWAIDNGFEEIK